MVEWTRIGIALMVSAAALTSFLLVAEAIAPVTSVEKCTKLTLGMDVHECDEWTTTKTREMGLDWFAWAGGVLVGLGAFIWAGTSPRNRSGA